MLRARALDLLRGLLPASSLSHMGIFATGQAYESLILHLRAHPLPEARRYGSMILHELEAVIPSFVARIERPDRGVEWVGYLRERERQGAEAARRFGLDREDEETDPGVDLLGVEGDELDLVVSLLFEASSVSERQIRAAVEGLSASERGELIATLIGPRSNRRHRPGRGFERLRYRFEIVSDYAAFRDMQRHRLLTAQWQGLSPYLGAQVPADLEHAGVAGRFEEALESSRREFERLAGEGLGWAAPYSLCLAYRIRYVLDMTAREALHVIELRSGKQGHTNYRAIAQEMHAKIESIHPGVAAAMEFVDHSDVEPARKLVAKLRSEQQLELADAVESMGSQAA
jgi:thymidylate synthase ThyX